jgi:hypothetical protein
MHLISILSLAVDFLLFTETKKFIKSSLRRRTSAAKIQIAARRRCRVIECCKDAKETVISTKNVFCFSGNAGFGDVNISAILNSFQMGYDKRVRPNYGGET